MDITTKYDIGQEVFYLHRHIGKLMKGVIHEIHITVKEKKTVYIIKCPEYSYILFNSIHRSTFIDVEDNNMASSYNELVQKLRCQD